MAAEQERRDRIVAAAERLYEARKTGSAEDVFMAVRGIDEACQPIEPPYKPLLSDGWLASNAWIQSAYPEVRMAGAATLEAMADELDRRAHHESADLLRERAREERSL